VAIAVKPPRLLAPDELAIELHQQFGGRMFVEEHDTRVKVQQVSCHELAHACSAHLRLPTWLNEGIAILTVDRYMGRPTIRPETLAILRDFVPKTAPLSYRALSNQGAEAIVYHSLRGYWLVRYMEAQYPGLLRLLFSRHSDGSEIEQTIIRKHALEPDGG